MPRLFVRISMVLIRLCWYVDSWILTEWRSLIMALFSLLTRESKTRTQLQQFICQAMEEFFGPKWTIYCFKYVTWFFRLFNELIDWLIDWLTDWLTMIVWLNMIYRFINWSINKFYDWLIDRFIDRSIDNLIDWTSIDMNVWLIMMDWLIDETNQATDRPTDQ